MTFYLKPVEGSIPVNLLQTYAEVRLRYLTGLRPFENGCHLLPPSLIQYADCLIEGTAKDRVSHFALRSVSLLHPPLHAFVINKERLLFSKRLFRMTFKELEHSLVILSRQLQHYEAFDHEYAQFFRDTKAVARSILKSRCLRHVKNCNSAQCTHKSDTLAVKVPFQYVLALVAQREVVLSNGKALLRCDQVQMYLSQMFITILEYSSQKMGETPCLTRIAEDPRFTEMLNSLREIYDNAVPGQIQRNVLPSSTLGYANLDHISQYFPPCMRAIHHTLRTRHRLCHRPRIQYTLYMKEIGFPANEFLKLLEMEYSRPAVQSNNEKHKCEHSWGADSRRYKYGTRHLYGLEGGRKNYSSHSCSTIQSNTPGPNECGGCPFSHFDKKSLKRFLAFDLGGNANADNYLQQIQSDTILPIESCHMHLRFKLKHFVDLNSQLQDPPTQDVRALENSQVKSHSVLKPKHYFVVLSKLTMPST